MTVAAGVCAPVILGEPRVIESSPKPLRCAVAGLARRRESRRRVVRIVRFIVRALVTCIAVCRCPGILPAYMAARTRYARVRSRQRKRCLARMVEARRSPPARAVAYDAVLREPRIGMIRIVRPVVCTQMTRYTFLVQSVIDSVLMTAAARN